MPIIPYLKSRILRIFTLRMSESVDIVSGVQKVGENLFILQAKLYHVC
jgi:predicted transcriptional regulator